MKPPFTHIRKIATSVLLSLLCACSNVYITDSAGHTKVERSFGVTRIQLPKDADSWAWRREGIGLYADSERFSLGYLQDDIAALTPECRIVIWADASTDPKRWEPYLSGLDRACFLQSRSNQGNTND